MTNDIFMEALYGVIHKCPIRREKVELAEWLECLEIAGIHNMIPDIYPVIAASPAACEIDPRFLEPFKKVWMESGGADSDMYAGAVNAEIRQGESEAKRINRCTRTLASRVAIFRNHFSSGVLDLRYLVSILRYVEDEGDWINWDQLLDILRENGNQQLAGAIFRIGFNYLGVDLTCYPGADRWVNMEVDEEPLLNYLLNLGRFPEEDEEQKTTGVTDKGLGAFLLASPLGALLTSAFRRPRDPAEELQRKQRELQAAMEKTRVARLEAAILMYGLGNAV